MDPAKCQGIFHKKEVAYLAIADSHVLNYPRQGLFPVHIAEYLKGVKFSY